MLHLIVKNPTYNFQLLWFAKIFPTWLSKKPSQPRLRSFFKAITSRMKMSLLPLDDQSRPWDQINPHLQESHFVISLEMTGEEGSLTASNMWAILKTMLVDSPSGVKMTSLEIGHSLWATNVEKRCLLFIIIYEPYRSAPYPRGTLI